MGQASDVLVVDDDVHIREFVQLVLSGEGYEVVGVPHGAAALTLLEQREQGRQRSGDAPARSGGHGHAKSLFRLCVRHEGTPAKHPRVVI